MLGFWVAVLRLLSSHSDLLVFQALDNSYYQDNRHAGLDARARSHRDLSELRRPPKIHGHLQFTFFQFLKNPRALTSFFFLHISLPSLEKLPIVLEGNGQIFVPPIFLTSFEFIRFILPGANGEAPILPTPVSFSTGCPQKTFIFFCSHFLLHS